MQKIVLTCATAFLCLFFNIGYGQSVDSTTKVLNYPSRLFGKLQAKISGVNNQLSSQTQKYLQKMASQEARMQQKLMATDSVGAKQLFGGSANQYAALIQKMKLDTGRPRQSPSGQYQPYVDSLQSELAFLKKNPQLLNSGGTTLQGSISQLQAAQAKMQVASQAQTFMQQRRMKISQYIAEHASLQGIMSKYTSGMSRNAYYFSQQVKQYRDMLNSPDRLEQKALSMVSQLSAYQNFMKSNSQLSGLFKLQGGGGAGVAAQALPGLQTHSQISQQVQGQLTTAASGGGGGDGGMGAIQSKVQSAQSELDSYKAKLGQLGGGNTAAAAPDFRPNDQKTKSLWNRLEYGVNFETTHSTYYYPATTDLGLTLGYRLGHSNVVGIGASYKIGLGTDFQHIALSGQGVGLRSFLQVAIKSGFSATGGFEYNYTVPFTSYQQLRQLEYWTRSGLIGLSKTVSMKSRVFKKAQLQLLWDFLSYQQIPQTQPLLFRIGYSF
jgi:hypothetical protein